MVVFAVAGLVAGCQFSEVQRPACECPNTEMIVASLDWFADGTVPAGVDSAGGEEGHEVGVFFDGFVDADDATAALDRLYDRLVAAGLMSGKPPLEDRVGVEVELADASLTILPPLVETNAATEIGIDVALFVSDERASGALEPLVAALGTIG